MQFRRFNDHGVKAFVIYLDTLRTDPTAAVPLDLLDKPSLTEPLDPAIAATPPAEGFASRMDFACWLHDASKDAGTDIPRKDPGFWAWLTLALFDQVCPANAKGQRKVRETVRYVPDLDASRRYYRHTLVGAYLVYLRYERSISTADPLLCGPLSKPHDEAYRLFVENQLLVHVSAVETLRGFYYNPQTNRLRKGSQGKGTPGSIRRFAKLLSQYARTYDLDEITSERLAEMLPPEFNKWREFQRDLATLHAS